MLWTDESKFNLLGSDGRVIVWRTPQEAFDSRYTVLTVKHGGGNVNYWCSFSSSSVGNLVLIDENMSAEANHDILQRNLFESVKKTECWDVIRSCNMKHRTHLVTKWLDEKGVERVKRPLFTPDLNHLGRG